jgi:hypothetical protein
MNQIVQVIKQMIDISEDELNNFPGQSITKTFKRQEILSWLNAIANEIFFIIKGGRTNQREFYTFKWAKSSRSYIFLLNLILQLI